jgi:hypothetical protein
MSQNSCLGKHQSTDKRVLRCRSKVQQHKKSPTNRRPPSTNVNSLLHESYFLSDQHRQMVETVLLNEIPQLYNVVAGLVCHYLKPTIVCPQALDVRDEAGIWLQATALRQSKQYLAIHYNGYGCEFDDWIHINSPRLAPLYTFTQNLTVGDAWADLSGRIHHNHSYTGCREVVWMLYHRVLQRGVQCNAQPRKLIPTLLKFVQRQQWNQDKAALFAQVASSAEGIASGVYPSNSAARNFSNSEGVCQDSEEENNSKKERMLSEWLALFAEIYSPSKLTAEGQSPGVLMHSSSVESKDEERPLDHTCIMQFQNCPERFRLKVNKIIYNKRRLNAVAADDIKRFKSGDNIIGFTVQ